MLILGIAGFFVALAVLCFVRYNVLYARGEKSGYDAGGSVLIAIAILVSMIGFLVSGAGWAKQISDFEDIKKYKNIEVIYKNKAEALTAEFAKHLAESYPEHEKNIYEKISPDKVYLYFAKYPELKASETLVALVERINKLQTDVYDQQINVEFMLKNTRYRLRNPWLFTFMIPYE